MQRQTDEYGQLINIIENGEIVREPVDRGKISDQSISELEQAVQDINDTPTRNAIAKIVEILTGQKIEG